MTVAPEKGQAVETVTLTIDGIEVTVPKGTLVIRAAEQLGIAIPRFCDHPLLKPAGACRQCLVEVEMGGRKMPKPQASCTITATDGMVVKTQLTSEVARKAQEGIMEFLLINHPLDCPMCDKGGECPLQNQAMSTGRPESRFTEKKREYPKPLAISSQILLDRERCILCQRCTRFSDEIAGDKFIDLMDRSSLEQIGIFQDEPFNSYFSGNTVQICPVGALTGAQYRFRARPFDLVSTPSICEHCSAGCAQRTDWRRNKVLRRLAGEDPEVNEEWNCDKGRWAFQYATARDRLTTPLVRDARTGELRQASWSEAFAVAAEGLARAKAQGGVGVLTGGRLTVEDAYAYAKFARVVLGTNDIDFRARPHSAEEAEFLAARVSGVNPASGGVTYSEIENASTALLVGLEPEEEVPILFLRLRKAATKKRLKVYGVQPFTTPGLSKLKATLIPTVPGSEAALLAELCGDSPLALEPAEAARQALREPGAVILVGERLATIPGALSAVARLADVTGARLAWVPRRAGDRGAVDAGCLPNLLPGARPVTDEVARTEMEQYWGLPAGSLPAEPGRDLSQILAAAGNGQLAGLVVAGVELVDLADPRAAEEALDALRAAGGFLVSLELRMSAVARRADVVFPVAPAVEKAGSYLNWEGRVRSFDAVLNTGALPDCRVLDEIAEEMGVSLGTDTVRNARTELGRLPATEAPTPLTPWYPAAEHGTPEAGQAVLATWHHLLDEGSLQDEEPHLAGTRRTPVVRLSPATAAEIGASDGEPVTVGTSRGAITLPLAVTDMPDRVVWLPTNSPGSTVRRLLGVDAGAVVSISSGGNS